MSTHNLCFEQKYEKYQSYLSENFQFLEVKFSIYLNRLVFVMRSLHFVFAWKKTKQCRIRWRKNEVADSGRCTGWRSPTVFSNRQKWKSISRSTFYIILYISPCLLSTQNGILEGRLASLNMTNNGSVTYCLGCTIFPLNIQIPKFFIKDVALIWHITHVCNMRGKKPL